MRYITSFYTHIISLFGPKKGEGLCYRKLTRRLHAFQATTPQDIAAEAADVLYFTLTACVKAGVELRDVEHILDARHLKVKRRTGDAKPEFVQKHVEDVRAVPPAARPNPPVPEPAPQGRTLRLLAPSDVPALHRDPVDPFARGIAEKIMQVKATRRVVSALCFFEK